MTETLIALAGVAALCFAIWTRINASRKRDENRPAPTPREKEPYDERSDRR